MGNEIFEPQGSNSPKVGVLPKKKKQKLQPPKIQFPDVPPPDEQKLEAIRKAISYSARVAYQGLSLQLPKRIPPSGSEESTPLPPDLPVFMGRFEIPPLVPPSSPNSTHKLSVQLPTKEQAQEILRDYYSKLAIVCSAMPDDTEKILKKVLGLSKEQYKQRVDILLGSLAPRARVMLFSKDFRRLSPEQQQEVIARQFIILGEPGDLQRLGIRKDEIGKANDSASFVFRMPNPSGTSEPRIVIKRYSDFYRPLIELTTKDLNTNAAKFTIMAAIMHEIAHEFVGGDETLPHILEIAMLDSYIQKGLLKVDTLERSNEIKSFVDALASIARRNTKSDPSVETALNGLYATYLRVSTRGIVLNK